jgi:flagellar hook-length control protein FliK
MAGLIAMLPVTPSSTDAEPPAVAAPAVPLSTATGVLAATNAEPTRARGDSACSTPEAAATPRGADVTPAIPNPGAAATPASAAAPAAASAPSRVRETPADPAAGLQPAPVALAETGSHPHGEPASPSTTPQFNPATPPATPQPSRSQAKSAPAPFATDGVAQQSAGATAQPALVMAAQAPLAPAIAAQAPPVAAPASAQAAAEAPHQVRAAALTAPVLPTREATVARTVKPAPAEFSTEAARGEAKSANVRGAAKSTGVIAPAPAAVRDVAQLAQASSYDAATLAQQAPATPLTSAPHAQHAITAEHAARAAPAAAQVAREIFRRFDGESTRFELRLDPPELGRIEVRLEVTRDHRVTAVIAADTPQALSELARHARDLEQTLQSAGLELGENGLSFDLRQGGDETHEADAGHAAGACGAAGDDQPAETAPARPIGLERWRGVRLDVMV